MTITIRLPKKLEADLRSHMVARGVRLPDFVRAAIAEKLEREQARQPSAYDLGRHLFGKYGSGRHNLSSSRKAILDAALRVRNRR